MMHIFTANVCWNIFDYADQPEPLWSLQRAGRHAEARRAAIGLTLRHPIRMIPVIIDCLRNAG